MKTSIDKYKIIGTIIILLGLLFNEYTIKIISGYATKFATFEKSIAIIIQILIVVIGIYVIIKNKSAVQNIGLTLVSMVILFTIIELVLTIFYSEDIYSDRPIWIPAKYVKTNNKLYEENVKKTLKNKYGFNDEEHIFKKNKQNDKRIAILGDSFIWGAGVTDSVIWTNKLKGQFLKDTIEIEILNWGKSGWSTADEFNFCKKEGIKYQIDLLIFAFVINDPVTDESTAENFIHKNGFIERVFFNKVGILLPNTMELIKGLLNNFFAVYFDYGYKKWLDKHVYNEQNLRKYEQLLTEIKYFCEKGNLKFIFVLTPENHSEQLKIYLEKIEQILSKNEIKYLNLYPYVKKELGEYTTRQLWANPADGHPNNLVNNVYAKYVYKYLIKEKFIQN